MLVGRCGRYGLVSHGKGMVLGCGLGGDVWRRGLGGSCSCMGRGLRHVLCKGSMAPAYLPSMLWKPGRGESRWAVFVVDCWVRSGLGGLAVLAVAPPAGTRLLCLLLASLRGAASPCCVPSACEPAHAACPSCISRWAAPGCRQAKAAISHAEGLCASNGPSAEQPDPICPAENTFFDGN